MSAIGDIMSGLKTAMLLTDQVEGLSQEVRDLSAEVRDIDRRLARLEGAFAFASRAQGYAARHEVPARTTSSARRGAARTSPALSATSASSQRLKAETFRAWPLRHRCHDIVAEPAFGGDAERRDQPPVLERVGGEQLPCEHHAVPGDRRFEAERRIGEACAADRRHRRHAGLVEPARPVDHRPFVADDALAGEVGDRLQPRADRRRADRKDALRKQELGPHIGPASVAEPDRQVDVGAVEVGKLRRGVDAQQDVGIGLKKRLRRGTSQRDAKAGATEITSVLLGRAVFAPAPPRRKVRESRP